MKVIQLFTTANAGEPMESHEEIFVVEGKGIRGDRYFNLCGTYSKDCFEPDRHVTLMAMENIDYLASEHQLEFSPQSYRRNIITSGVDLSALVGRTFYVGSVLLKGIRQCEPCAYLAKKLGKPVVQPMIGKGGIRAEALSSGSIVLGAPITTD